MTVLELRDLTGGYGDMRILHGISLSIERGKATALVGANGAGKTTLMRTIAGLLPVSGGTIRFNQSEIAATSAAARVQSGIALVPEGRLVFPTFSVEENLRLGAIAPRARPGWRARKEEMFGIFPRLAERSQQSAGSLSGGEQQMLAIARGLMALPDLLLLDEPTLGLAPVMVQLIFETLARLREAGLTLLIAEQDVRRTLDFADSACVIENGRVAAGGSARALREDPRVRAAYLGR
ncbi:MAG: ABC transporter ATP-binding protein [Betaproteobacteria bacterium]|nr:ABC transporter ATP-binding protein [Betaproteobacteria bacterium]